MASCTPIWKCMHLLRNLTRVRMGWCSNWLYPMKGETARPCVHNIPLRVQRLWPSIRSFILVYLSNSILHPFSLGNQDCYLIQGIATVCQEQKAGKGQVRLWGRLDWTWPRFGLEMRFEQASLGFKVYLFYCLFLVRVVEGHGKHLVREARESELCFT